MHFCQGNKRLQTLVKFFTLIFVENEVFIHD